MPAVKLSQTEMQYITILQGIVNVTIKDCIVDEEDNKVVFVVSGGQAGLAIGKRGMNINKLKEMIAKDVEIIEHSSDPAKFIRNCFLPIIIREVTFLDRRNGKAATVEVDNMDKGRAIGRSGKNINKVKNLVLRQFDIVDVMIKQ
ncbi:MAG: NusA-like transcription termination signal-binding factor [Candidatus Heimdallarchaeota archaeon]|nr:NusA-like transcription termination signal-binding factor [Candidatus Heimdallarchaeota archaeon]MCK5142546.1 NusA-like transcription termination signal-binding factor [Candidatus Heimdallarchaeota archaeon]